LEQRLQKVYRHSCEEGRAMAVVMCDIDHFKVINDTHGHAAGDEALILVAQTLDRTRREEDICCRYGGEEFTLLLKDTDGEQAFQIAERLRQAVESLRMEYEGKALTLRISCGVAAFPELHVKTGSELQLLADEALYSAKEEGRNRCMLHLGKGRFRDAKGWMIEAGEEQPPIRAPRIFD
jgi:diguanylate cyclase (GGDEF)-like protein